MILIKTALGILGFTLATLLPFDLAFASQPGEQPFHLDLEARATEYTALQPPRDFNDVLDPIISVGKRNLDWLQFINSKRSEPLSFSSKETQHGIPMDKPNVYNTELIQASYSDLVKTLPKEMTDVLIGNSPFTENPPVDTARYLELGRQVDMVYQLTVRWNSMKRYLALLVDLKLDDVRGYFFLNADQNLQSEFATWSNLDSARKDQLVNWLTQICANSERDFDRCGQKVLKLSTENELNSFYNHYFPEAENHWNSYFKIQNARRDIISSDSTALNVAFRDPGDASIMNFLKLNIEDEWHWLDWHLILNFTKNAMTHIEFAPGQVPHVDRVGGSTITMDRNSPLSEYNVQWTIRHEYGHTLGFLDCYIEFYDLKLGAIVSYQFDTTNLMCSRQGHLKETHFLAIKEAYQR